VTATYGVRIDFDGDNGLTALGNFESLAGTDNWTPGGSVPPTVARSTTRAHNGDASLLVTWGAAGTSPLITHDRLHKLAAGVSYTIRAQVYVPTGSPDVLLTVAAIGTFGAGSTTHDAWEEITFTFTAPEAYNAFQLWPTTAPDAGDQVWFDEPTISIAGEDVSTVRSGEDHGRVNLRQPLTIQYGRDQSRSLSPPAPGEMSLALYNMSGDYSPENSSSPLAGNLLPGRAVVVKATLASKAYTLFNGNLDDYTVLPNYEERSVQLSAVDALARLRGVTISTDLYQGIRTGDAVNLILDAAGWSATARDIDVGATTIRWWWEERTDALEALKRIVNSEGPPSLVTVSGDGRFLFRDRHHRLLRTESTTSQATFRDTGTEPVMTSPLSYDHGWRDVINSVSFSVEERDPAPELADVFSSDRTYSIADGQTLVVRAEMSDPFYGAVIPVAGTDYQLTSGTVEVTLSRTQGASATIFVKATGGPAQILGLRVRAYPVQVVRTIQVHAEDADSIGTPEQPRYGRRSWPNDAPWAGVNDAEAIADLILAQRAERLPIVSVKLVSANDTRLTQMLSRDLSDRITIVDAATGLNDDFYIEQIQHSVSEGLFHETVFGCEMVPATPTGLFRFDVAGAGFNDGKFGGTGLDDPDTIFLFDSATQGFDDGEFAH
jgi:hypothetical protein